MIGEPRVCAAEDCNETFVARSFNQKYHNDACCRLATNKRISDNYYKRKAIKLGMKRTCMYCPTELSRYNPEDVCANCATQVETDINTSMQQLLTSVVIA